MDNRQFANATVVKKANVYFDGKVTSRTIYAADGKRYTLGFMLAGEYEFPTAAAEIMEMLGGEMHVMLPGETSYSTYGPGTSYRIPANSSYKMIVKEYVDYCCSYIEE